MTPSLAQSASSRLRDATKTGQPVDPDRVQLSPGHSGAEEVYNGEAAANEALTLTATAQDAPCGNHKLRLSLVVQAAGRSSDPAGPTRCTSCVIELRLDRAHGPGAAADHNRTATSIEALLRSPRPGIPVSNRRRAATRGR